MQLKQITSGDNQNPPAGLMEVDSAQESGHVEMERAKNIETKLLEVTEEGEKRQSIHEDQEMESVIQNEKEEKEKDSIKEETKEGVQETANGIWKCDWCKKKYPEIIKVECDMRHTYCKNCFREVRKEFLDTCLGTKKRRCFRKLSEKEISLRGPENIPPHTVKELPFVGPSQSIMLLQNGYANKVICNKISLLYQTHGFSTYRAIRGDGNCFYRALAVLLLEDIKQQYNMLQTALSQHSNSVSEHERATIENALQSFMANGGVDLYNHELSQAFVHLLRMMTSYSLRHNEVYRFYFENETQFEEKCRTAERMGEEAEHMEINALLSLIGITCQLIQLDRNAGDIQLYTLPDETAAPRYFLLYRPGHYDILYK